MIQRTPLGGLMCVLSCCHCRLPILPCCLLRTVRLLTVAIKLSELLIVAYRDVYSGINATAIYRTALSTVHCQYIEGCKPLLARKTRSDPPRQTGGAIAVRST